MPLRTRFNVLTVAVMLLAVGQGGATSPADGVMPAPDPRRIMAHVGFLADDLLEGREAGTRGYDLAAKYVASQMVGWGLEPAGDDGSFFQQVRFRQASLASAVVTLTVEGETPKTLAVPDDLIVGPSPFETSQQVDAPVVFAGFGVSAPELGYDDYAGLDVNGKIVLVLRNAPAAFPTEQRAYHASQKARNAARHGAVGLIQMGSAELFARYPWERFKSLAGDPSVVWLGPDGTPGKGEPQLSASGFLSPDTAAGILATAGLDVESVVKAAQEKPVGRPLPVRLAVQTTSHWDEMTSANVAGRRPGSDPALAATSVVLTSHLDHVGLGRAVDGDAIYNGAYDNAMGSAILLEIGRLFASAPAAPARSVVFLFVTAEEKGLLGSDYFARYPTKAAGEVVANVNLDMPLFLTAPSDVVAFGAENSSLEGIVARAVGEVGLTLAPDPLPEENLFVRSDQYSFVQQGIPSVYLMPGFTAADPSVKGGELINQFIVTHYHQPSDDLTRPVDAPALAQFARANYLIARAIADHPEPPAWKPGNFFGELFAKR